MGTLKPQSNGPLYSNTVIGTLAVDGWAVTFGTARRGLGGLPPGCNRCIARVTIRPVIAVDRLALTVILNRIHMYILFH